MIVDQCDKHELRILCALGRGKGLGKAALDAGATFNEYRGAFWRMKSRLGYRGQMSGFVGIFVLEVARLYPRVHDLWLLLDEFEREHLS